MIFTLYDTNSLSALAEISHLQNLTGEVTHTGNEILSHDFTVYANSL